MRLKFFILSTLLIFISACIDSKDNLPMDKNMKVITIPIITAEDLNE